MKHLKYISIILTVVSFFASCKEKIDTPDKGIVNVILTETSVSFDAAGGVKDVTLKATGDWKVASSPDWIKVTPSSGNASQDLQTVTLNVQPNSGPERSAEVKFAAGNYESALKVTQASGEAPPVDHLKPESDRWYVFRKADKVETGKSYVIVAKSKAAVPYASEINYGYMNSTGVTVEGDEIVTMGRNAFIFVSEGEGYTMSQIIDGRYIYLKDDYNSFQVGNKPASGHVWMISSGKDGSFTIKNKLKGKTFQYDSEYGTYAAYKDVTGILPFLYECIEETDAPDKPSLSGVPEWLELPQVKEDDGLDFYSHDMIADGKSVRSWSFYYDPEALLSHWVAYPLNKDLIGHGSRTDAWDYDPLVPVEQQPALFKSYSGDWQRGHQLPSADRLDYDANVKTFYFTNMTPQNGGLNEGVWADLEQRVREWSAEFDTLYVVTGCSVEGSTEVAKDNDGKEVTVPVGYYKALLGYSKSESVGMTGENGGYTGCAFWFDNKPYSGSYMDNAMTISELEERTGVDFFVNLDPAVAEKVEKTEDKWWK